VKLSEIIVIAIAALTRRATGSVDSLEGVMTNRSRTVALPWPIWPCRRNRNAAAGAAILSVIVAGGTAKATQSATIQAAQTANFSDANGAFWAGGDPSILGAYQGGNGQVVDGYMKFGLSAIPSNATIVSMTLTTYHISTFQQPVGNPPVRIYRVDDDNWGSYGYAGLPDQVLTPVMTGFPSDSATPYTWQLDVSAFDPSVDLRDKTLSLAMRDVGATYSYVYWYTATSSYAPQLSVTFQQEPPAPEPASLSWLALGGGVLLVRHRKPS
jgi:hypothetical protein